MTPERPNGWVVASILAFSGCAVSAPQVKVDDDILTLATASWSVGSDERSRVQVDGPDGPWLESDWQEGASPSVPLLGLLPDTDYSARVVAESGYASEYIPFSTGSLPPHMPDWTTSGEPGWEGYLLTAILGSPSVAVILDEHGRVVWYRNGSSGPRVLRVRLRPDNKGIRFAEIEQADITTNSQLVSVDWDGTETSRSTIPGFSHDFVDAPDGRAACVVEDVRENGGKEIVGDSIALVDDEGATETVWDSWDAWPAPQPDEITGTNSWTHANAIDWDPDSQSYWLGMRNQSTILQVFPDGSMGTQIGGADSSYAFPNPEDVPEFQHQFQLVDGGIVMFDDRDSDQYSRVLELSLDDEAGTATAAWTWHHDPEFWVYALGDVDRAADGSTLVVFSSAGTMDDIGPDGELRWELQTQLATGIPYFVRLPELPGVHRIR